MSVVIAKMRGGLGNQMFQYAMARAVAWRNRAQLKLDLFDFIQYSGREFGLGKFKIQASIASDVELGKWGLRDTHWSRHLPSFVKSRWYACISHYFEPHYHFAAETRWLQTPIFVAGFWHSYKYFDDCAELIRAELTLAEHVQIDGGGIAKEIRDTASVSLHVRRGDYISNDEYSSTYVECRPEYYARAISYLTECVGRVQIFVFSDDPHWIRTNLPVSGSVTFASEIGGSPIHDLYLMSLCKHHITANSSFSWWGAWLNASPDKIVITPERWYHRNDWSTRDLIPPEWIRM